MARKTDAERVREALAKAPNCRKVEESGPSSVWLLPKQSLAAAKAALTKKR